jgi:organic hydroperoxide reductase OsmC/OhrA
MQFSECYLNISPNELSELSSKYGDHPDSVFDISISACFGAQLIIQLFHNGKFLLNPSDFHDLRVA